MAQIPRCVVHFIPRFLPVGPDTVVGGSNNALWNLAVGLKVHVPELRQVLVTATSATNAAWFDHYRTAFDEILWQPLPTEASPLVYGARAAAGLGLELAGAVRRLRPDIVHGHSGYPHYALVSAGVGRLTGTPAVHSLYCPLSGRVHDRERWFADPRLGRQLLRGAERVVAMSEHVASSLAAADFPPSRTVTVHPGLRPALWESLPPRAHCRRRFDIEAGERVVLFVGNPSEAKGIDVLIRAAEELFPRFPAARLFCTFELDNIERASRGEAIHNLVARSPIRDRIRFLGLVDRITELMRAADVVVFPFRNAAGPSDLPIALMESMAVGTPVVATDLPGNREVTGVPPEGGRLVPVADVAGLAGAVGDVLSLEEPARRALGEAAASRARGTFDAVESASLLWQIYVDIVRRSGRGRRGGRYLWANRRRGGRS